MFDRTQRGAVHQFHRRHRLIFQHRHRFASGLDVGKDHQRRSFMGMFLDRAIGELGDEAQRALGTDHQMLEDFEGVFVIHQSVEAVTAGVLDLELVADTLR